MVEFPKFVYDAGREKFVAPLVARGRDDEDAEAVGVVDGLVECRDQATRACRCLLPGTRWPAT